MKPLFALVALAALGCAGGPGPAVRPAAVPAPTGAAPAQSPDPLLVSFRENLEHAKLDAERAGWQVREVVPIPGHHAAVVLYDPSSETAPATRVARVDAVGAGPYQVVTSESGMVDVVKTRAGSLLWDLRGDGSAAVVIHLTPCGANCGVAKPLVVELAGHAFKAASLSPECPTCLDDRDRDGVPELEFRLATLTVAPCSRASCGPASALLVEVRGLERWDGQRYARDLAVLRPLYAARLRQAESDAESVKKSPAKARTCPLNALGVAARLYVYARLGGESRADALARADRAMSGWDTQPCATEYDLLAAPRRWQALRTELEALPLPTLK